MPVRSWKCCGPSCDTVGGNGFPSGCAGLRPQGSHCRLRMRIRGRWATEVDTSLPALRPVRVLDRLRQHRGMSVRIVTDGGREFTSGATHWCSETPRWICRSHTPSVALKQDACSPHSVRCEPETSVTRPAKCTEVPSESRGIRGFRVKPSKEGGRIQRNPRNGGASVVSKLEVL
jgi:hypothetical protein